MRLRCGRTSARGSAGKPAGGAAGGPSPAPPPHPVAAAPGGARRGEPQRAERLEDAGLVRHGDGGVAQRGDPGGDGRDESPVPDQDHGAVDLALVVEAVDVAGDALEEPAEDAPVGLALVGEVRELALGEHGAAAGDGDAVRAGLGQRHGVLQRPAEPGAQTFDGLAGPGRTTLVGLVAHVTAGVAGEDRVAAAADADHVERSVGTEPGDGLLLRDLLRARRPRRARRDVRRRRRSRRRRPAGRRRGPGRARGTGGADRRDGAPPASPPRAARRPRRARPRRATW